MEAILFVIVFAGQGSISTERISSVEECKNIVTKFRDLTQHHVSAFCIPANPITNSEDQIK